MRPIRLLLILLLTLLLLATGSRQASAMPASQTSITMAVTGGYGDQNAYLIGEWFPVRVTLRNSAGASTQRVRVAVDSLGDDPRQPLTTYSREVDLPAPSLKEITLYAYSSTFNRTFDVRLMQGDSTIDQVKVALNPYEQQSNLLIGVLSSDTSLLNVLNGEMLGHTESAPNLYQYGSSPSQSSVPARATVVHMNLADLPPLSNALDSLGVIVVDDLDTGTLSVAQKAALSAWVGRGGMLIGLGRPGGASALSAVADLLPVTPGDPRTLTSLTNLGQLVATPITPTGQILAPSATLRTGPDLTAHSLASQDGTTLVAVRELGRGHTAYVGLSPAITPLKIWDGTVPLFKRIIAEHPVQLSEGAARRVGSGSYIFSAGGMFDMPGLDLPSEGVLAIFLLVYIMIIGPINFIVLRRMRRAELAWLTIPAVVLLFSIGAYIVGFGAKGGDLLTVRSNVVHTVPGLPQASVEQYFGIFSPQHGNFDLDLAADGAIAEVDSSGYAARPDNAALVTGGGDTGPTRLSNVNINTLSLRAFMAESATTAQSPLEASLYLGDGAIEGTVKNRSDAELQDVALIRGNTTQLIGTLAPGQEAPVHLGASQQAFALNSPESLLETPPGVNPSGSPYYYDQPSNSDAQRNFNRKVQLLNVGLGALISGSAPSDMSVLALAWGPASPVDFSIPGHNPRTADLNLWSTHLQVRGDGPDKPRLQAGSVPFVVYAPASSTPWLDSVEGVKLPVSANPYVDLLVRLPPGTTGDTLNMQYASVADKDISVLVFNVHSGTWDPATKPATGTGTNTSYSLPDAANYVGPAGDVTFRLLPVVTGQTLTLSSNMFSLNANP